MALTNLHRRQGQQLTLSDLDLTLAKAFVNDSNNFKLYYICYGSNKYYVTLDERYDKELLRLQCLANDLTTYHADYVYNYVSNNMHNVQMLTATNCEAFGSNFFESTISKSDKAKIGIKDSLCSLIRISTCSNSYTHSIRMYHNRIVVTSKEGGKCFYDFECFAHMLLWLKRYGEFYVIKQVRNLGRFGKRFIVDEDVTYDIIDITKSIVANVLSNHKRKLPYKCTII